MNKADVISHLHRIGAIKFGHFTLKSGATSPIYIDMRPIVSYPDLLRSVATLLWDKIKMLPYDLLCGVPYTALPIATCLSLLYDKPMVLRRKEKKVHGTKKAIEGVFEAGQQCLVIEDVVTTGGSILETIADLEEQGLRITDVAAFLEREPTAKKALADKGYHFHSVLTLQELLETIKTLGVLSEKELAIVDEQI